MNPQDCYSEASFTHLNLSPDDNTSSGQSFVARASPVCSPGLLSPASEDSYPSRVSNSTDTLSQFWKPPPPSFSAGYFPCTSPTEELDPQYIGTYPKPTTKMMTARAKSHFDSIGSAMTLVFSEGLPGERPLPTPPAVNIPERMIQQLTFPFNALGSISPPPEKIDQTRPQFSPDHLIGSGPPRSPDTFESRATLLPQILAQREKMQRTSNDSHKGPCTVCSLAKTISTQDDITGVTLPPLFSEDRAALAARELAPVNLAEKRLGVRFNLPLESSEQKLRAPLETPPYSQVDGPADDPAESWLGQSLDVIVSTLKPAMEGNSMKLLSHALPSPVLPGHAFPDIIEHMRRHLPSEETMWISLLHAVPGQFRLEDIPSSPASTPGPVLGSGRDYFALNIIESAVSTITYNDDTKIASPRSSSLSAPGSIDLAMVERYIPPASMEEMQSLYNPNGRSLLVDRMSELSPKNGCLVFIYPTRQGGETFAQEYLGPILDPMLRSLVIVNNFSADLSGALGRTDSVASLQSFEAMEKNIRRLCRDMNGRTPEVTKRLHHVEGVFELAYASKQETRINRTVWTDWWIKQEKSRIRNAVTNYLRTTKHDMMRHTLIQDIFDGIKTRPYPEELTAKIELGVFVIQRRAA